ncbi:hypothetical protein PBAC_19330 [Pedobacter glucosidilyticus]|nr:hypothetical protein PBAC_19330 [Pedobacter glucosidilyticus]
MKKKLLFIIIILSANISFGQKNQRDDQIVDRVELMEKQLDSVIKYQESQKTKILEERINQATETIANQNSIITSFGTLYAIITIVFALIGIALPILTYQFGIRPSQEALKDFEKNSEKKFNEYLKEKQTKEIDNAINNLKSEDSFTRINSINYLSLNYHLGFNSNQINALLELLKDKSLDENTMNQIYHCISNQKNENVKEYYVNFLSDPNSNVIDIRIYYCIRFLSNYNLTDYKSNLATFISNNESSFITITIYISQLSKSNLLNLFNEKQIINCLNSNELKDLKDSYESYLKSHWKIDKETFEKTYLFKKINTYS